jgi:hypothetical protein
MYPRLLSIARALGGIHHQCHYLPQNQPDVRCTTFRSEHMKPRLCEVTMAGNGNTFVGRLAGLRSVGYQAVKISV